MMRPAAAPALCACLFPALLLPRGDARAQCVTLVNDICREETTVPVHYQVTQPLSYWMVVGVVPARGSDRDITLYPQCQSGTPLAGSYGTSGADFIVGDFNHMSTPATFFPMAGYGGTGPAYRVSFEQGGEILPAGPFRLGNFDYSPDPCYNFFIYDLWLTAGHVYRFDFGWSGRESRAALFRNPASAPYWAARGDRVFELPGPNSEYTYIAPATDWYGLVLFTEWHELTASQTFWIEVEPLNDCVPLVAGACDAKALYAPEGNDDFSFQQTLAAWTAVVAIPEAGRVATVGVYTGCDQGGELLSSDNNSDTRASLVVADFHHHPTGTYYPVVWGGTPGTNYTIEWAGSNGECPVPGTVFGTLSTGTSCNAADARDIHLDAGTTYQFVFSGPNDARTVLHDSDGAEYWAPRNLEEFEMAGPWSTHEYTAGETDDYGLVTFLDQRAASGDYYVSVEPLDDCFLLAGNACTGGSAHPADFAMQPVANYWAGVSVRPFGNDDKDVGVHTACDGRGTLLQASVGGEGADFVVGDFNHNPPGTYYPRVTYGDPAGQYIVECDNGGGVLTVGAVHSGQVRTSGADCGQFRVWDIYLEAGAEYEFHFTRDGPSDTRMALFRNPGNGTYWANRSMSVFELAESGVQTLSAPATDWYGLVIFANEWPGTGSYWVRVLRSDAVTGIGPGETPVEFALHGNVPNPFNPETEIRYALPRDGQVDLAVFDVSGRRVRSLVRGPRAGGEQRIRWDGRDDAGRPAASGVYVVRLAMDGRVATRKVVLLK